MSQKDTSSTSTLLGVCGILLFVGGAIAALYTRRQAAGVSDRVGDIRDSDEDGRLEKARNEFDDLEKEIDENLDNGKDKTKEILEDARGKVDELEDQVRN